MKKNFLDVDTDSPAPGSFGFATGFKFGFGMFVAWLLGLGVLSIAAYFILRALKLIA